MADTFFDTTGVLFLEKVTPIIKALFVGYEVADEFYGDDKCYIAMTQYGGDSSWDTVIEELVKLAQSKGMEHGCIDSGVEIFTFLAKGFGVENDERFRKILANESFTEETSIDVLYELAVLFDDGHKLSGYLTESGWHSTRASLFGFGGIGIFQGKHYGCTFSSSNAGNFGQEINKNLSNGNLDAAAEHLQTEVQKLLDGVVCENQRTVLKLALSDLLKS